MKGIHPGFGKVSRSESEAEVDTNPGSAIIDRRREKPDIPG